MGKYLALKFENAVLFDVHRGTNDIIIKHNINGPERRIEGQTATFIEPITHTQICNVIHVLFGERPVPHYRNVFYNQIKAYSDKANDSYLVIETPMDYNSTTKNYHYLKEAVHTRKAVWNCWKETVELNWSKIKRLLTNYKTGDNTMFYTFVDETSALFGYNVVSKPITELKECFLKSTPAAYGPILDKLKSKTALKKYLTKIDEAGSLNSFYNYDLSRTAGNGLDFVNKLHGHIYVPVDDQDIERLSKVSPGVCTILDGGMVSIEGVVDGDDILIDNLRLVSDISTKKKFYVKKK